MKIYLYIKTHNITGLKYFGKTIQNPYHYPGSGTYWRRHLKMHGCDVTTKIVGCFEHIEECKQVAIKFSKENDIVVSKEWANLCEENLDGPRGGKNNSEETRMKKSKAQMGNTNKKGKCQKSQKNYIFISPKGQIFKIKGLVDFCLENNLSKAHMCCVASGKRKQHMGWKKG